METRGSFEGYRDGFSLVSKSDKAHGDNLFMLRSTLSRIGARVLCQLDDSARINPFAFFPACLYLPAFLAWYRCLK